MPQKRVSESIDFLLAQVCRLHFSRARTLLDLKPVTGTPSRRTCRLPNNDSCSSLLIGIPQSRDLGRI